MAKRIWAFFFFFGMSVFKKIFLHIFYFINRIMELEEILGIILIQFSISAIFIFYLKYN